MLARVAENVYWLARYLERAENTARLISVNTNLLLDLPAGYAPGWEPLVDISGGRHLFAEQHKRPTEREVVHFLIADPDNPGSIYSSLRAARDNARSLRDSFPAEAWELRPEQAQPVRLSQAHRAGAANAHRFAGRHPEPQRRLYVPDAGPQPRARRHDQPHRGRALRAAARPRQPSCALSTRCNG